MPHVKQYLVMNWLRQVLYSLSEVGGVKSLIFIMVGTPLLPPGSSSFNQYPIERQRILDLINVELELENVFFLSGDCPPRC